MSEAFYIISIYVLALKDLGAVGKEWWQAAPQ